MNTITLFIIFISCVTCIRCLLYSANTSTISSLCKSILIVICVFSSLFLIGKIRGIEEDRIKQCGIICPSNYSPECDTLYTNECDCWCKILNTMPAQEM